MLKFYLWVMSWAGELNSWAWRKQAAIVRHNNSTSKFAIFDDFNAKTNKNCIFSI